MAVTQYKVGDVLSESSHYTVEGFSDGNVALLHHESGDSVYISDKYITKYLESADEVIKEMRVTKEDKKDGTLGIRSIFENIHGSQVFTVCYKKQDEPKSQRALQKEIETMVGEFCLNIDTIKNNKKGVAEAAKKLVEGLVSNPILPYKEGEDRVLRGFKTQFDSRDGKYLCVDMDINDARPVNINTIKWLIINGIKYIVQ